ncbi:diguanylate cyclase YdeH [mine drainage metagenome]|uniref:Diguanylate cyclase YdeH n=1 Tax=mine drainage metagenome TaxID=410659 RepID=A0A1J5R388_9ZZZZ
MELYDITREDLQDMLSQLEQARFHHQLWHAAMVRVLACRLPADQHDICSESHHKCRFGQWYYSERSSKLRNRSGYIALGKAHKFMHQLAAKLLIETSEGKPLVTFDFDNFSNSLDRMRLEISALERELENALYNHDSLTGAINRTGILPALREQQELIKRELQSCCIVMVDLDNFKVINDLHGHLAGDNVLTASAHYLIEHIRPYDKVFRYGGEEFLLLLQHTELTLGFNMVERLREEFASMPISVKGKEPIHITASFGITLLDPATPVETSIDRVDKAMYAAKAAGRNCVRIWDTTM